MALVWQENLNLRGGFRSEIREGYCKKHPELRERYDSIYQKVAAAARKT